MSRVLVLNRFDLTSARYRHWIPDHVELHLVTTTDSMSDTADTHGYASVQVLDRYRDGGSVELLGERLHRRHPFDQVLAVSEYDLLRAARLHARWELGGRTIDEVLRYRDKAVMKATLQAHGVPVAPWMTVDDVPALLAAVDTLGFPLVVKPRLGAASRGVYVLHCDRDVEDAVARSPALGDDPPAGLLVERFVAGSAFHVDGFVRDRQVMRIWPSQTTPNLDVVHGRSLVSAMLESDDARLPALTDLTERALHALGKPAVGLFHCEVFHTRDGQFVINEVGARLGGGRIKEVLRRAFGVDPLEWYVRTQFRGDPVDPSPTPAVAVGYGKAAARPGRVTGVPATCPVPGVTSYYPHVSVGERLGAPTSADDCLASFVVVSATRDEVVATLTEATEWAWSAYDLTPTEGR